MNVSKEFITNFNKWCQDCTPLLLYNSPIVYKLGGIFIPLSKSGNKIHIKKKNRGKFTDYCGGKVTSECIARGKNSPSPTIRKRATFALNSRRWNKK